MKQNKKVEGKLVQTICCAGFSPCCWICIKRGRLLFIMNQKINIVELFSGIGGFSKGLMDAGFDIGKHYFSEIDKHAIANYKYNFKDAESIGSVTDVRGRELERPDIITFGSPCQDFSLAGKRKGMDGQRSSLILHAIRLIGELKPDIFIWENVKGAYSSNDGADFWGIIRAFANIGGYRLEWQLLNTSWFLPQNRERIYLIGHLAEGSGRNIFPITENGKLFNQQNQSDKGRTQVQHSTTIRAGSMRADDTFIQAPKVAGTLTGGGHSGGLHSDMTTICVAQRGRNPVNPSDRTTGAHTEQRLEPNSQGTTNTLTGVQKDNLIMVEKLQLRDGRDNRSCLRSGRNTELGYKGSSIRRLTEIECERLQGFPDNWTEFGNYDGKIKSIPKTQRYKLLGNAVTTNVVKEIGLRLLAVSPL